MARLEWNKPGERFFEAGVERGVLFPKVGPGVAWNGLVSVNENVSGGEMEALYFDGVKYIDLAAGEDFQASVEAYSAPAQFAASDGQKSLAPGLYASQQIRQTFGLSYRTLKGNDLVGSEYGHKLHLVWNCTAAPSGQSYQTIANNVAANTRSWTVHTVPPPSSAFKPTAHLVIDSNLAAPALLAQLEDVIYGSAATAPRLPTIAEVVDILTA